MRAQKICFLISSLSNAGGTERVCITIANKLSELGYAVTILSMYDGAPFFILNNEVKITFVWNSKFLSKLVIPATILRIRKKMFDINPDILINVDSALFIYSKVALLGLQTKNIIWEHFHFNAAKASIARLISRKLAANYADTIITLTHEDTINWKKGRDCKVPVITINNPSPSINYEVNYSLQQKQIVLSVGRLSEQKGFDLLLKAWHMVMLNDVTGWVLHIVGSGELKEDLEKQIMDLGLSGSAHLIPANSSIHNYYKQASIYCLSSRYEGFPMVLLEAQAFGLPLVSFDCETGPAEIIQNNQNGLLVKKNDCPALAQALIDLMRDKKKRETMGANAFNRAANYDINLIIKDWQNMLATI